MELRPSLKANMPPTSQEIRQFMKTKSSLPHSQVPATCSYLKPDISVYEPAPSFLIISFNIIFPSTPWFSKCYPFLRSSNSNPLRTSSPPTCYMLLPSHASWFNHSNNIWWGVQIINLIVMYSSPLPCNPFPLRPKYFPTHPVLKHPQLTFLPHFERPSFIPIENNMKS